MAWGYERFTREREYRVTGLKARQRSDSYRMLRDTSDLQWAAAVPRILPTTLISELSRAIRFDPRMLDSCRLCGGTLLLDRCRSIRLRLTVFMLLSTAQAAVAPQIKGGDHIYLIFTYSEAAIEGKDPCVTLLFGSSYPQLRAPARRK